MRLVLLQSLILVAFIVFPLAMAEDQTEENVAAVQNTTFHNHSIYFEIPDGWEIYSDIEDGDNSSTIITDGMAAIRIDTIKLADSKLDELVRDYLQNRKSDDYYRINPNVTWYAAYEKEPYYVVDSLCEYYKN